MEKSNIKETELFLPIKDFFENLGYKVQAEVKNCDIICVKNNEITTIELKKSFNLKLLYQAMERKSFSNYVYIGINRPKNFRKKEVKHMLKILESLEIGLITVALDSPTKNVSVVLAPPFNKNSKSSKKRAIVLKEVNSRNLSSNLGGSSSKNNDILTAYKEKSIFIACVLQILKNASPKDIKNLTNIEDCGSILRSNYFSYFEKVSYGVYSLSNTGNEMLSGEKFKDAIKYYKKEAKKICLK